MTIKRYTYLIIYIIASVFFAACTSDDVEREKAEGEMTHVSMTLATRATGTPEAAASDAEKIGSWWVVFVSKTTGNVQKIVSHSSFSPAVEEERVELDIPVGTYTLYSFANITPSATSSGSVTIADFTFTEGAAAPLATDINAKTFALTNGWTGAIPMTGTQSVTVTGRANETFSIEVVRMLAKMEFQYRNSSSKKLDIVSLTLNSMQTDEVPLLPDYGILENGWKFPTTTYGSLTSLSRTYDGASGHPAAISLAAYSGSGSLPSSTDKFYMQESTARQTESKRYLLSLNVKRDEGSPETLYFMLDKTNEEPSKPLQTIYRNDHVIVPLTITDYTIGLDASNYPPIGGYPQATVTSDDDLQSFYCTFGTQGVFCIKPTVYSTSTGANLMYGAWSYEGSFTFDGNTDIFVKSGSVPDLTIDPLTGEIVGKLTTATGTACITIQVKVVSTSQVYTRHIYIIRA